MRSAAYWIERLDLAMHPEGGYFKRTYEAEEKTKRDCLPVRFKGPRPFATAIYYLLSGDEFSAFHRLQSDEMWHFYDGSPAVIYTIDDNGRLSTKRLGKDFDRGERLQVLIRAGSWFGAMVDETASYCLAGCTVSPGFEFEDFELGNREALIDQYPEHSEIIMRLTRPFASQP